MGEAAKEIIFENPARRSDKEKELKSISKHVDELEVFFKSMYVTQTRKQEFGFRLPEQFEVRRTIQKFKDILSEIDKEKNDLDIVKRSHLEHILGNSIVVGAGGMARRYESGKYFSDEDNERELPVERFKIAKEEVRLILYYIGELVGDRDIVREELKSSVGYLEKFLGYFSCDLPSKTTDKIKLFKFFRDLEKGMSEEEFSNRTEEINKNLGMKNLIDVSALSKDLVAVNDKKTGESYLKYVK